jgi:hypothetical protein
VRNQIISLLIIELVTCCREEGETAKQSQEDKKLAEETRHRLRKKESLTVIRIDSLAAAGVRKLLADSNTM